MSQTWKKIALYTCGAISGVALSIGAQSFAADKKTDDNLPIQWRKCMGKLKPTM